MVSLKGQQYEDLVYTFLVLLIPRRGQNYVLIQILKMRVQNRTP